jgi:hypothetical protein
LQKARELDQKGGANFTERDPVNLISSAVGGQSEVQQLFFEKVSHQRVPQDPLLCAAVLLVTVKDLTELGRFVKRGLDTMPLPLRQKAGLKSVVHTKGSSDFTHSYLREHRNRRASSKQPCLRWER